MSAWTVGAFHFEANSNRLRGPHGDVQLEPKASALLAYFCEHPGRSIGRDELLRTVWHGQVVSDNSINRVVVLLRKALGDDAKVRRYIATVPKVGYRLIAQVSLVDSTKPLAVPSRAASGALGPLAGAALLGLMLLVAALAYRHVARPVAAPSVRSVVPLSRLAVTQSNAALASDGSTLLYTASDGVYNRIYQVAGPGAEPVALSAPGGDGNFAAWGPDERFVVYQFFDGERCEFHRLDPAHPAQHEVIYECVGSSYSELSLSPDGATLYFLERASAAAPYAVFALDLQRSTKRRLSQPVAQGYGNHYVDVHPRRGTLLLLSDHAPGKTSLFELDPTNESFSLLMAFDYGLDSAIWSHRDGHVVHPSRHPSYKLLETSLESEGSTVLVSDSRRISSPRRLYRPGEEGRDYLFTSYLYNRDIELAPTPSGAGFNSAVMDYLPAISHNAQQLAFVSKRAGYSQVWIRDLATGQLRAIDPPDKGRRFLDLRWSRDDGQLLANTNTGVLVYSLEAGAYLYDVQFALPAYAVAWWDAQTLSLSHYENQRWRAYRYRLDTGETIALDERWAFSMVNDQQEFSLDQSFAAFLDGRPLSELQRCADPVWRYQWRWRFDGDTLYCHAGDAATDLLRFDGVMTAPTRLGDEVDRFEFFSVREGKIAKTRAVSAYSDIMRTD